MFGRATIQVTYCFARAVNGRPVLCSVQHVQKRLFHDVLRTVPVFPELQDYPTAEHLESKTAKKPAEPAFKTGFVRIRTGGSLYEKWRKERRYWSVPDGDVPYSVEYMDTGHVADDSPTVVALHGSPGSYTDFNHITRRLNREGVRVVAPCFPGDLWTFKYGRFRHTPEEKCAYVRDFLKALSIPKVDLLLCHSSALFASMLLCLEEEPPRMRSLALLNPTAFDMPKVMRPFPLTYLLARMAEFPVGHEAAAAVGKMLCMFKKELKEGHQWDHILAALTMIFSEVPKNKVYFEELMRRNFPVMLAFSENDKLISKQALYKMADMMVKDQSEIQYYDRDGRLQRAGGTDPSRKVLAFEKGTHFLFKKHPQVIAEEITSFLFQNLKKD